MARVSASDKRVHVTFCDVISRVSATGSSRVREDIIVYYAPLNSETKDNKVEATK